MTPPLSHYRCTARRNKLTTHAPRLLLLAPLLPATTRTLVVTVRRRDSYHQNKGASTYSSWCQHGCMSHSLRDHINHSIFSDYNANVYIQGINTNSSSPRSKCSTLLCITSAFVRALTLAPRNSPHEDSSGATSLAKINEVLCRSFSRSATC